MTNTDYQPMDYVDYGMMDRLAQDVTSEPIDTLLSFLVGIAVAMQEVDDSWEGSEMEKFFDRAADIGAEYAKRRFS